MAQKSKMFRVATEGATTDGRRIERSWITQMAANYDPKKYGARVWMEHMRGLYPDSAFRAYGDVLAVEARDVEGGKLGLFAEIAPLPDLVAMTTKAKQKIYTSMEINPKFADTGQAYLVGLAVTDSPASLGTEVLSFAAQHPEANPFAGRKTTPDCLFSEAVPVTLEFEDLPDDDAAGKNAGILQSVRDAIAKFSGRTKRQDGELGELAEAVGQLATAFGSQAEQHAADGKTLAALSKSFTALQASHQALQTKFDTIDTTDAGHHKQRPPATGGDIKLAKTDC